VGFHNAFLKLYFTRELPLLVEIFAVFSPVLICALTGFIWAKSAHEFPSEFISKLVLNIAAPCLVVSSIGSVNLKMGALLEMALATGLTLVIVLLVGYVIIRVQGHAVSTFLVSLAFPNVGNMGLPLAYFAFGDQGLALAVGYFMVISIAHFSVGMAIATGDAINWKHFFLNPILAAITLACLLVFSESSLPLWLANSVGLIGQLTIPLMLLTLGVSLAQMQVRQFSSGFMYSVLRVLLGGAAAYLVVTVLGMTGLARSVVILMGFMPVAVFNYLFALKSQRNVETVASMVMISTVLAMFILPVVVYSLK
jgi:predicted permease